MQRECGIPVTGVFDVSTMRGFAQNANRFSDSYISARVEQAISKSKFKVPRGCIDVVKAIENPVNAWTSAYASYHDVNGNLDSGIRLRTLQKSSICLWFRHTYENDIIT
jgi:hypothetical protein